MTNEEYYLLNPKRHSQEAHNSNTLLDCIEKFPETYDQHVLYNIAVTLGRISDCLERIAGYCDDVKKMRITRDR